MAGAVRFFNGPASGSLSVVGPENIAGCSAGVDVGTPGQALSVLDPPSLPLSS